ncbi:MAG: tRNA uridine-5-carboxymethylaminomethyl(34) synthesis GTPase MnmE [Anaerovoracaceae bacterium]|jgi:tRNA modification GTPase
MAETIAAISTAFGEGGIGIVKISGDEAERVLNRIFVPVSHMEERRLTYGRVIDPQDGSLVDEALAVVMHAPHTYTCEDVVEIDCHGSTVSLRKTLALAYANGARPAEPGEFTKRAFLNGRIDLSQAEAVMDVVSAKTEKTFDVAIDQLEGRLSKEISEIRAAIMDILVDITVNIDYPDEDIEEIVYSKLEQLLQSAGESIDKLLQSADTGRIISDGLRIAIIGRPNVGKSSLMNALLKESRAIVTEIPGTTRDTIEEMMTIKGIPVMLTDTAGIRSDTNDEIEKIGIQKSKQSFNDADLIIFMIDAFSPLDDEDIELMEYVAGRKSIVLLNKQDLGNVIDEADIKKRLPEARIIQTSLKDMTGVEQLEDAILDMVYQGKISQGDSLMVTNARHESLLQNSKSSINDAIEMTRIGEPLELIEIDIHKAFDLLGEIIGESVSDDIIDEVFARFCLGK